MKLKNIYNHPALPINSYLFFSVSPRLLLVNNIMLLEKTSKIFGKKKFLGLRIQHKA